MREFLKEQAIELTDERVIECRYSVEQGRQAMHQLLTEHPDITAVFCGNDILALGALWGARELGISVPDQLSVTGFDNLDFALALSPQLTTVNAPSRRMGEQAAEYLLKQIENKSAEIEHIELEAELIVRESTSLARG
jgi:LacI family transcriptional regulator